MQNGREHTDGNAASPLGNGSGINQIHHTNGHGLGKSATNSANSQRFMPIAICGMACRLPGKVNSPEDLWEFLISKGDARMPVPDTRYSGYYSPIKKPGAAISEFGYFLDESIDLGALDTSFFSFTRAEAERLDPQQRLLLEVARESLDDAGEVGWKGKNIGVYVGSFGNDWYDATQRDAQRYGMYQVSTTHDFALSNRVSYEMDLRGPSMTIRTACSSSLICLNEACAALAKGDCTSAIVAGSNLLLAPALTTDISEQGALSADGSCKTFSSSANGYARGEGVVAVYVKPLADALRDGSSIRAVVIGTATNADGKTPGFSVPSADAQEALIRRTYELAGVSAQDVTRTAFFECHGTGTPVGDPIETQAIANIFGNAGGVHIGSIKPNLGHGEGASGLTAVLKAVLALEHLTIPPNIKSMPRSTKIPFEEGGLKVPVEPTQWPEGRAERVSVNSFGVGGANAHVILESVASMRASYANGIATRANGTSNGTSHVINGTNGTHGTNGTNGTSKHTNGINGANGVNGANGTSKHTNGASEPSNGTSDTSIDTPQILVYSANSAPSLKTMTERYAEYMTKLPEGVTKKNIAYTLANGREHLPFRAFSITSKNGIDTVVTPQSAQKTPTVVMVFTGQGAQWPQMGREVLQSNPVFRSTIKSLDGYLKDLGTSAPDWTIEEELLKPPRTSRVNDAAFSQPLCTAIQLALVDTLTAVGIKPAAVVGHSSGEIAAAYAAGGLTARDAIVVGYLRGLASEAQTKPGSMAAVGLGWKQAQKYLIPGVVIACHNSPTSVTLSGDTDALQEVVNRVKQDDASIPATTLKITKAYHSHHMTEVGGQYHLAMKNAGVSGTAPSVPFYSSLTGGVFHKNESNYDRFDPRYWRMNLESPVLFNGAVSSMLADPELPLKNPLFLELGPHPALAGPLRQILQTQSSTALLHVPTFVRRQNSMEGFLSAIGNLWAQHAPVDFKGLMPKSTHVPGLPRYPWNHQRRYWWESRVSKEWRLREHAYHDLLGSRVPESSAIQPVWRNLIHLDNAPWLRDHKVRKDIVFPFAGYVATAAEAVRQISGVEDGVELRDVNVSIALVLREESPTEIVTSFNRHRLTDDQESNWWNFTIGSYNGHTWTKHCFGQIRALPEAIGDVTFPDKGMPNRIPIRQWYERGRLGGSGYGFHFTAITEMVTSAGGPIGLARAKSLNGWHGDEANYHVHPVVVDTYLQVLSSAAHHGNRYHLQQLLPASVASLSLSRCTSDDLDIFASSERYDDGFIGAGGCIAGSKTIVKAKGVTVFPLAENVDSEKQNQTPISARIEWVPLVESQSLSNLVELNHDPTKYFAKLELLGQLAVAISQRSLSVTKEALRVERTQRYRSWLDQQAIPSLKGIDLPGLSSRMAKLVDELATTPAAPAAAAIAQVCANIESIISGAKDPLAVLNTDDILGRLRAYLTSYNTSSLLRSIGSGKPNMHVLELGAGVDTDTAEILDNLERPDGQVLYSKYVYTNTLPGPLAAAKDRFKSTPKMNFAVFDIGKDPVDQDLQDETFDLIIATDIMHMTPDVGQSLKYAHGLLNPDGYLLMQQPSAGVAWIKYVLGILPSWWCGAENGRVDEPYLSLTKWEKELAAAGFSTIGDLATDSPAQSQLSTVIVAKPQKQVTASKSVTILCHTPKAKHVTKLTSALKSQGYQVDTCSIADTPPAGQDAIGLLDVDGPFFDGITGTNFEHLKKFLQSLGSSAGLLWITRPSQTHCPDPRYGPVIGLARTIRSEMDIDFATCETDDLDSTAGFESLVNVFNKFHTRDSDTVPGPDFEFDIRDGVTRVNRFYPFQLYDELEVEQRSDEAILAIDRPGRMDSLRWAAQPVTPVQGDEVQVEVYAAGLNFRDVLIAAGIITLPSDQMEFGYEAAGIVRQVGPNVKNLSVGDKAIVMGIKTFATVVNASELLCTKLPEQLSFAEGASMPIVFATAIYSLVDIANLQKGQSILIHSACGGVGLAALQLAQSIGADIYATVSSEEKVAYLMKTFGLPRHRILQSRNDSFVEDIMRQTNDKGVDVVLNSLSGELLHATWRCVARWGTMVEIGKRDLLGQAKLDMGPFLNNRNYRCVAIDRMREERPDLAQSLLQRMMDYVRQGTIRPVRLAGVFSASAAPEAFKYMQKGAHIGKVVISLRDSEGNSELGDISNVLKVPATLDGAGSYLLIGGLGGLGRSVAIWMVQRGARNLVFLSRSAGTKPEDQEFVHLLNSMDCNVQLVRGSVTNAADVQRAVDGVQAPLKGIIQMSMLLRDTRFDLMTIDDWNTTTETKVQGTWYLHEATLARGIDLDFFLLFSSMSGVIGQPGQANYAAANTFLDAFVLYRNSLGLQCTAIDVGAMQGAGYLFENEELMKKMQGIGWNPVEEDELLDALGAVISRRPVSASTVSSSQVIVGKNNMLLGLAPSIPLSSPDSSARLRRDVRMAVYHNVGAATGSGPSTDNDRLRTFLRNAQANPSVFRQPDTITTLAQEIGKKLFALLLKPDQEPDITASLSEIGLDSMVAVEVRAWWKLTFGLDISVLEMLAMGTLEALGKRAGEELAAVYDG